MKKALLLVITLLAFLSPTASHTMKRRARSAAGGLIRIGSGNRNRINRFWNNWRRTYFTRIVCPSQRVRYMNLARLRKSAIPALNMCLNKSFYSTNTNEEELGNQITSFCSSSEPNGNVENDSDPDSYSNIANNLTKIGIGVSLISLCAYAELDPQIFRIIESPKYLFHFEYCVYEPLVYELLKNTNILPLLKELTPYLGKLCRISISSTLISSLFTNHKFYTPKFGKFLYLYFILVAIIIIAELGFKPLICEESKKVDTDSIIEIIRMESQRYDQKVGEEDQEVEEKLSNKLSKLSLSK